MNVRCCVEGCKRSAEIVYGRVKMCNAHFVVIETGLAYTEARQSMYFVKTWGNDQREDQTPQLQRDMSDMLDRYTEELDEREVQHGAALTQAGDVEPDE